MALENLMQKIETKLPHSDKSNAKVSARGVDWHLDHSLKIIAAIAETLKKSDPSQYKPKFSIVKEFILFTGYMPRGKAPSPKPFNQLESIDPEQLKVGFEKAKEAIKGLENLPPNAYFSHPMFGHLNLKVGIKFIKIHSEHHLKIMDDIIAS